MEIKNFTRLGIKMLTKKERSEIAKKAVATRIANAEKRSNAAKKAWETRRALIK